MKTFEYQDFKIGTKFEWVKISETKGHGGGFDSVYSITLAAKVPRGWLIKEIACQGQGIAPALQFIEDPDHYLDMFSSKEKK